METRKIVMSALFAALIYITTSFLRIPFANGYVHLGDLFIFLACYYVGGWYAVGSAVVGSTLADLLGYPQYALATFAIKAVMAGVVILIGGKFKKRWVTVLAVLTGALVMIVGYFAYEWFILGPGMAVAGVLGSLLQGFMGAVLALPVILLVDRARFFKDKSEPLE
jgi:uncharacterized membrane protein